MPFILIMIFLFAVTHKVIIKPAIGCVMLGSFITLPIPMAIIFCILVVITYKLIARKVIK